MTAKNPQPASFRSSNGWSGNGWSRRRLLQSLSGVLATAVVPARALALQSAPTDESPFSHFVDVSESAGLTKVIFYGEGTTATYITEIMGGGCAFFDFDNDGDLDILIMNQNEPPSPLRNDAPAANHWIKVRLHGTRSNRSAIGARVVIRSRSKVQAQELMSQSSYVSSHDPRLHFGLGSAESVDIEVRWPLGAVETHKNVPVNQLITLREGSASLKAERFSPDARAASGPAK